MITNLHFSNEIIDSFKISLHKKLISFASDSGYSQCLKHNSFAFIFHISFNLSPSYPPNIKSQPVIIEARWKVLGLGHSPLK